MSDFSYFNVGNRISTDIVKIEIKGAYIFNESYNETVFMIVRPHELQDFLEHIESIKDWFYEQKLCYVTKMVYSWGGTDYELPV